MFVLNMHRNVQIASITKWRMNVRVEYIQERKHGVQYLLETHLCNSHIELFAFRLFTIKNYR
jgi:hypothetical protein